MRIPRPQPRTGADRVALAAAVVLALAVLGVGLSWLGGITTQWGWQESLGRFVIIGGAIAVLIGYVLFRFSRILGVAAMIVAVVGTVVGLTLVVEEVRVGSFSESERRPTASEAQVPTPATFTPPPESPLTDPALAIGDIDLTVELVADGFEQAISVVLIPGTRDYLVAERTGKIYLMYDDGSVDGSPLLNLMGESRTDGERGLFDLTFNPAGDRLYVSFSDSIGDNQISSWSFEDHMVDLATRLDVITVMQPYETHNGGSIRFGPDGYLYTGIGDGGRLRDPLGVGQDRSNRLGTILRILPDELRGGYLIPPDNPYLDMDDVWPEIYAYGARNPWRFNFDSATGDFWIGDVGQSEFEEIHYLPMGHEGGANFGWRFMVGNEIYVGPDFDPTGYTEEQRPADHVPPVFTYPHDPDDTLGARSSVTGGLRYRGTAIPELYGAYLYGDWTKSEVGAVVFDDEMTPIESEILDIEVPLPTAFVEDADGEVLIVSIGGSIWRLIEA